jgi:hypothetical protein
VYVLVDGWSRRSTDARPILRRLVLGNVDDKVADNGVVDEIVGGIGERPRSRFDDIDDADDVFDTEFGDEVAEFRL